MLPASEKPSRNNKLAYPIPMIMPYKTHTDESVPTKKYATRVRGII